MTNRINAINIFLLFGTAAAFVFNREAGAISHRPFSYDTVYVTDYGVMPDSRTDAVPGVKEALKACKKKLNPLLVFPRGRYDFWPQHAVKHTYFESNTTDVNPRANAVLIKEFDRLTIEGNGSSFIYHGKIQPFAIDHSHHIKIDDLTIDWEYPLTAQAKVRDTGSNYIDIHIDSEKYPYKLKDGKLVFFSEGWEDPLTRVMEFDKNTHLVSYNTGGVPGPLGRSWKTYKAEKYLPGIIRLVGTFTNKPIPGNILILEHSARAQSAIFITRSKNIILDHITGFYAPGIAILSQYSENLFFNRIKWIPDTAKGRYFSGHADGMHFSNCRGQILVDSACFEGLMDDPINIHGTYVKAIKRLSNNKLLCRFMHPMSVGMIWAEKGDKVSFVNNETLATIDSSTVTGFKPLTKTDFEISFSGEIPKGFKAGYGLENTTWTTSAVIKNSFFGSNRARGILVTTPKKVIIENNTFATSGSAILIAGDINSYYESGAVKDVLIKGNKFLAPCNTSTYQFSKAVISIFPQIPGMNAEAPAYHQNIRIVDNIFHSFDYPVLFAESVDGLVFSQNDLIRSFAYKPYHSLKNTITLIGCRNITIRDNKIGKHLLGKNIGFKFMSPDEIGSQRGLTINPLP